MWVLGGEIGIPICLDWVEGGGGLCINFSARQPRKKRMEALLFELGKKFEWSFCVCLTLLDAHDSPWFMWIHDININPLAWSTVTLSGKVDLQIKYCPFSANFFVWCKSLIDHAFWLLFCQVQLYVLCAPVGQEWRVTAGNWELPLSTLTHISTKHVSVATSFATCNLLLWYMD